MQVQKSEFVRKLAVFVFRVRNQFLIAAVHHPIQIFQRKFFNAKTPRRKDAKNYRIGLPPELIAE
jgi:hypothetical protein